MSQQPILIICMGVSGSGKSTVAAKLARQLNYDFLEADDFHSPENKQHMAAGKALTDAMREPWINAMCERLKELGSEQHNCVLAYSGLRRAHRDRFRHLGFKVQFILLTGSKELIAKRMNARKTHFMPSSLLDSQFAAMEPPLNEPDIASIAIYAPVAKIYEQIREVIAKL